MHEVVSDDLPVEKPGLRPFQPDVADRPSLVYERPLGQGVAHAFLWNDVVPSRRGERLDPRPGAPPDGDPVGAQAGDVDDRAQLTHLSRCHLSANVPALYAKSLRPVSFVEYLRVPGQNRVGDNILQAGDVPDQPGDRVQPVHLTPDLI